MENKFNEEIVRVLSTDDRDNCLKYKPFFEKHGYKVECTRNRTQNGWIYNLRASKENNINNQKKDDTIISTIITKDPTVKIRREGGESSFSSSSSNRNQFSSNAFSREEFSRNEFSSNEFSNREEFSREDFEFKENFNFRDENITLLNTFDSSDKCRKYVEELRNLGWKNVKCHKQREKNGIRYYVYACKEETKMEARIDDYGVRKEVDVEYMKPNKFMNTKHDYEDDYDNETNRFDSNTVPEMYGEYDNVIQENYDNEFMTESSRMYKMEDNTMRASSYLKEGISKQESERLIRITKNLYSNITRIWKISDKLGRNIKILGSKYKKLCLESKMQRTEYESVVLKLKALRREHSYLEDVKKRYLQYRQIYEKNKFSSMEKDEKIRLLEIEIANLKKFKNLDKTEVNKIKEKYETKLEDIKVNISNYKKKIDELTIDSEKTRHDIEKSTTIVDDIIEDRNCDTIYGGGENSEKINQRKMIYFSVYKYLDPKYIESMKTSVKQWSKLSNYIWGMNEIMNIKDLDEVINYGIILPNISNAHKKHYLLFLYQLGILKALPDKECKVLAEMLKLPVKNCSEMKKYFKKDIESLNKYLSRTGKKL